jgi:hypothetical protein
MVHTQPGRGNRVVVAGATLIAAAVVLGSAGAAVEAIALTAAIRRRIARMEVPPRELAKRHWRRSRVALGAAAQAWRAQPAPGLPTAPDGARTTRSSAAFREPVGV